MHLDVLVDGVADPVLDSAMERLLRKSQVEITFVDEVLLQSIDELVMSFGAWEVDIQDPYFIDRVVTCYDLEAEGEGLLPLIFYPDTLHKSVGNLFGESADLIGALSNVLNAISN
jgi:hypothetical protein